MLRSSAVPKGGCHLCGRGGAGPGTELRSSAVPKGGCHYAGYAPSETPVIVAILSRPEGRLPRHAAAAGPADGMVVVTGAELDAMDDAEFAAA
ncbi:hypothetical protein, partial [Nocardiopsis composta]|uniref:hypothetical protein n=1 Tax=Nocardiopsis composta TaxID=157465 RepID=UPI003CD06721